MELRQLLDLAKQIDPSSELFRRTREILAPVEEATGCSRTLLADGGLLAWPILQRMKPMEGWLNENEADLLIAATAMALTGASDAGALVEVGSYCGRSTCVIAGVVKALGATARVYAVDPHEGRVGAEGQEIEIKGSTLERLKKNLRDAKVTDQVTIIQSHSWEVVWNKPASLLFIDGLHDYQNVAGDFQHFESSLVVGGYAAFHDYGGRYPGVTAFVDELLSNGCYEKIHCAGSMLVMKRISESRAIAGRTAE